MASRKVFTSETRSVRRLLLVALVVGFVATALPVGATLAPSTFNAADGDLVLGTGAGADLQDWVNVPGFTTKTDDGTGQGDSSMGNGTKEDTPIPSLGTGGIPNNKSDLNRFYTGKDTVSGNKNFLYLAWVRNNTLGTANMDFEFNQQFCTPNAAPADADCSSNGLTPTRAAGDMLITFDFAGGGKTVDLSVLRWLTATGTCEAGSSYPCWGNKVDLDAFSYGEGAVNDGFTVTDPKSGNAVLEDKTFGEASINLTDANVLPQPASASDCVSFGSAYLKSRSSDSFTAAMKDYVPPQQVSISNCATISVVKTISGTTTTLGGAKFKLYKDDGDNTAEIGAGGQDLPLFVAGSTTVTECETTGPSGTNPGTGNCTWRVTSTGRYWLEETVRPTGYQFMDPNPKSIDITGLGGTHPQAIGNLPQPRDIAITKSDDTTNGRVNQAVFALYNDAVTVGTFASNDTDTTKTCTTAGQGTCKITGVDPGDYWVLETSVPAGYTADPGASSCTVSSVAYKCRRVNVPADGATTDIAVGFANPRQFKIVTFVCNEVTGTLYRSTVSLAGGTAKTTLDEVTGVTDAEICGLTGSQGATFPGLTASATARALSVTIPVTEAAAP